MPRVRTIEEIRHGNLLKLIGRFKTLQAFADAVERNQSQISQLKNRTPHSKSGARRNVDSELARHIEVMLTLEPGWMDNDHDRAGWPFPLIEPTRVERLSEADRIHVQKGLISLLAQYDEDPPADPPTTAITTGNDHRLGHLHEQARKPYRAASR